jgi:hypothetical protein
MLAKEGRMKHKEMPMRMDSWQTRGYSWKKMLGYVVAVGG